MKIHTHPTRLGLAFGLMTLTLFSLLLAGTPERAQAETICIPNGDDTYTQTTGDPATAPPGSIILGDGESCPEAEPTPPPEELPEPPECDQCPEEEPAPPVEPDPPLGETSPSGLGGGEDPGGLLVSRDDPSLTSRDLPSTGSGSGPLSGAIAGLALFAIAMRLTARRLDRN